VAARGPDWSDAPVTSRADSGTAASSDWWPAALGATRWRAWRRESKQTKAAAGPVPSRRFGPGYAVVRLLATPLYRALWRVHVEGGAHVPRRGPAILAANHVAFFDSVVLIMTLRRTLSFVGKIEYLSSWKTRKVLPALGMIPLDRSDGRRAMATLKIASQVVAAGRLLAIYPEGTRSQDGDLHAGHTGAAYVAMATGVAIVPTGIIGTDRIQPPGTHVPRPFRRVTVRFGTPIDPRTYVGSRRLRRRLITDDLMAAIQLLTGQHHTELPPNEDRESRATDESTTPSITHTAHDATPKCSVDCARADLVDQRDGSADRRPAERCPLPASGTTR
jgi:1-acyl-sn-glycerol-3-phosphate acyltransferase